MKTISRRKFLQKLTSTAMVAWIGSFIPAVAAASNGDIKYIRQIITKDITNSRTIMWQTDYMKQDTVLVYRLEESDSMTTIQPKINRFSDDGVTTYIYTAELANLRSGSKYKYKISCSDLETPWYDLHTPHHSDSFTALIFPDSQCSDGYLTWRNVIQKAYKRHPSADLIISMGDLVDNGEASWQWTQWQDGIDNIWKKIPFAPVMGNHETYNLEWLCRLPLAYLALFSLPTNYSTRFSGYYYSYDVGEVHFIVLNTMWDELKGLNEGIVQEQIYWLEHDAQRTNKKWKVVLMHKDVIFYDYPAVHRSAAYPNNNEIGSPSSHPELLPESNNHADIDTVGKIFMPYFDKLNIDVVFTAHQHTYRRHNHIYDFQPSVDKGPVYFCTGNAGNVRYNVAFTRRFDQKYLNQPETENYLLLYADSNSLKISCYLPDGKLVDEYTLYTS